VLGDSLANPANSIVPTSIPELGPSLAQLPPSSYPLTQAFASIIRGPVGITQGPGDPLELHNLRLLLILFFLLLFIYSHVCTLFGPLLPPSPAPLLLLEDMGQKVLRGLKAQGAERTHLS
jgi:hypothetical protein